MTKWIVKHQKLSTVRSKLDYWKHLSKFSKIETVQGNPDLVENSAEEASDELSILLHAINDGVEKLLTKKQRRAFQLIVREGITERQAAKKMRCSYQAIQSLVKSSAVKIRKYVLLKYGFRYT